MPNLQSDRSQQHSLNAQYVAEVVIVSMVAVPNVTENRIRGVIEMSPDLVTSSRQRMQSNQRVPAFRVRPDAPVAFAAFQCHELRDGILSRFSSTEVIEDAIGPRLQRPVDQNRIRRPAAHNSEILFADAPLLELSSEETSDVGTQSEQQDTGSPSVNSMRRIDPLPDLITQQSQDVLVSLRIDPAAMDKHAGWLIDGDAIIVAIQDFQLSRHRQILPQRYA